MPAKPKHEPPPDAPADLDRAVEIERLAALELLDYETARVRAAKQLGVRPAKLDEFVRDARKRLGLDKPKPAETNGQGRPVEIKDTIPAIDSVDGDQLATTIACALKNHVSMPDAFADVATLWILHSWTLDAFAVSPRLCLYSATKGCGKTTLLSVIGKLARRPQFAASITPAALFRAVEMLKPTLLIDELNKFLERDTELHSLLNQGHARGADVLRVLGEKHELRAFAVFAPVVFATLGKIPDDLEDRCLILRLQRKHVTEEVAEFREDRAPHLNLLQRQCARWAEDNAAAVAEMEVELPPNLTNRTADNWRPLFTLAEVLGGDWPERCSAAAAALAEQDEHGTGIMLLADIRDAFAATGTDRMSSEHGNAALVARRSPTD